MSPSEHNIKLAPNLVSSTVYEQLHGSSSSPLKFFTDNHRNVMDCELLEILASFEDYESAYLSVEDVLVAQPKSKLNSRPRRTPDVMNGSDYGNPMEDVRVNILINLEGL